MAGTDQLSAVFSALADPTRRLILAKLADRDAMVTELRADFARVWQAASKVVYSTTLDGVSTA